MTTLAHREEMVNRFGGEPATLGELARLVINVIGINAPVVGFAWDLRFLTLVPITHSAPLGKPQNFYPADGPMGYPGFFGRVWIRYRTEDGHRWGWGSDPFQNTLTYPGSGGAGSYNGPWTRIAAAQWQAAKISEPWIYSWDYRFYLQDWPGLEATIEADRTFRVLTNQNDLVMTHQFKWEDHETKMQDEEYLSGVSIA